MTRDELNTEFADRGYNYLSSPTRLEYIQRAVQELTIEDLWSFRRVELNYTHGEEILELGTLKQATFPGYGVLTPEAPDVLRDSGADLTQTGTPNHYYLIGRVFKTYPVTTLDSIIDAFSRYGWTTGNLTAASETDTPRMPVEMQHAILDIAGRIAKEENEDYEEAGGIQAVIDRKLEQFRANHLDPHEDEPKRVRQTAFY